MNRYDYTEEEEKKDDPKPRMIIIDSPLETFVRGEFLHERIFFFFKRFPKAYNGIWLKEAKNRF